MKSTFHNSDLVLIGGGHSHLAVIKQFAMKPIEGLRITVVSRDVHTPYSGMLPGLIAGHYQLDDTHIDLRQLCEKAGIRLFQSTVNAIDCAERQVHCDNRPPLRYDWLSINTGSQADLRSIKGADNIGLGVKPIHAFLQQWQSLATKLSQLPRSENHKLTVVGGGAASVEIILAAQNAIKDQNLHNDIDIENISFELVYASPVLLGTHNRQVQSKLIAILKRRNITLTANSKVRSVHRDGDAAVLTFDNGATSRADTVIWAIHAGSPTWLQSTDLLLDPGGFIAINQYLQSNSHDNVFAAGDIAHFSPKPLPKSGVYAVRAGRILAENIRRAIIGKPLKAFRPQGHFLSLLMTGDKHAIASKGPLCINGNWVWHWKDAIDKRFMAQYRDWHTMPDTPAIDSTAVDSGASPEALEAAMRCGGCGAKIGNSVLSRVMAQLQPSQNSDVAIGLQTPDDAAVINVPAGKQWLQTVDYFRAFIDDPYLLGRIATNHCLSDIYAMGATPHSALAVATVPYGSEQLVEDTLLQLMQGAVESLNEQNTALIGGHSSEGAELGFGLSVNGICDRDQLLVKGNLRRGLSLILTKALGSGTLLAANMMGRAQGRWIENAIATMLISNRQSAEIIHRHSAAACTDITGFGLIGHLLEMLNAADTDLIAKLDFSAIPILAGAGETIADGMLSSLYPDNVKAQQQIINSDEFSNKALYPILFDPQTAGGLLAAVPIECAQSALLELQQGDCRQAAIIGTIDCRDDQSRDQAAKVYLY